MIFVDADWGLNFIDLHKLALIKTIRLPANFDFTNLIANKIFVLKSNGLVVLDLEKNESFFFDLKNNDEKQIANSINYFMSNGHHEIVYYLKDEPRTIVKKLNFSVSRRLTERL